MELFRIMGTIAVDNAKAMKALETTSKQAQVTSTNMLKAYGKIGEGVTAVGKKLTSHITKPAIVAGTALAGITLAKGWSRMVQIDQAKAKLTGLGHSADDVSKIMDNALEAVKGTAYGMGEAATTAASAVAAGIKPGKELTRYLTLVGDAAAIAGADMGEMGSIFNKVAANGKISAEEMNQLADRGIPIWKLLAETTGMSMDQVREAVSSGKIGIKEFQDAIENGMGGAAKTLGSTTITGAISNIGAAISRIGANFLGSSDDAKSFAGQLLPILNDVQAWLGGVEDKAKVMGLKFGEAFGKAVTFAKMVPAPVYAIGGSIAFLAGPLLQLAGHFMTAQSAIGLFLAGENAASIMTGIATGELTLQQAALLKVQGGFKKYVGGAISSVAATVSDTAAKVANAVATSRVGQATTSAASKLALFAVRHSAATLATMGLAAGLLLLAGYMLKTGASAEEMADKIKGFIESAIPMFSSVIDKIADLLPSMIEAGINLFSGLIEAISAVIPAIAEAIPQLILTIVDVIVTLVPMIVQAATILFMGFIQAISQIIPALIATIPQIVDALINAIITLIPAIVQAGIQLFSGLIQAVGQAIPMIVAAIPQIITALVTAIVVLVPMMLQAGIQLFLALVKAIIQVTPKVVAAIPKLIVALVQALVKSGPKILQAGIKLIAELAKGLIKAIPQAVKAAPKIVKAIVNGIKSGGKTLISVGSQLVKWLGSGISSLVGWIGGKASSLAKSVINRIKSGFAGAVSAGANIVKGIWSGISGAAGWLYSKVASFAGSIIDKLKSKLGIHSPSKVAEEQIGKNLALGVAEGIHKNKKYAKKKAGELAQIIVDTAKKRLDKYQTYNEMTLVAEMAFWDKIRKQCKKGTDGRLEADKAYFEKKKQLNEQLKQLEDEYLAKIDEATQKITDRANSLVSAFSLFEEFKIKVDEENPLTGEQLMNNLQSQVNALTDWTSQMSTLKDKIGDTALYKAIQDMGVSSLQQVQLINEMSAEELKKYSELYDQRAEIAKKQAESELGTEVMELMKTAYKDYEAAVNSLGATVNEKYSEIGKVIEAVLTKADQVTNIKVADMADLMKNGVKGMSDNTKAAFDSILGSISSSMDSAVSRVASAVASMQALLASVSGSGVSAGVSVATASVKANAKGGILTKPTIFGYTPSTNTYQLGGEDGDEAIAPISTLKKYVAEAVASQNGNTEGLLMQMIILLQKLLDKDTDVYMDGDKVTDKVNKKLGFAL